MISNVNRQFLTNSLPSFFTSIIISISIMSAWNSINPWYFNAYLAFCIALSAFVGAYVSSNHTYLTGVFASSLLSLILVITESYIDKQIHVLLSISFLLGFTFKQKSIGSILTIISLFIVTLFLAIYYNENVITYIIVIISFVIIYFLIDIIKTIANWLKDSIQQLSLFSKTIIGFTFIYLVFALFYALLYQMLYQLDKIHSFKFDTSCEQPISFFTFFYFSIISLRSSPPSSITPVSNLSKTIAISESLIGIFLLVIFIKFALSKSK